jgi:FkbM family methyltransferase
MKAGDLLRRALPRSLRMALLFPLASLRWRRDRLRALRRRGETCRIRDDWEVSCHPTAAAVFQRLARDEAFQGELTGFIETCHPGMVLYDVGANYGIFTLAALRFGGQGARVVAIEPSPVAFSILQYNLRLAGAGDRVWSVCTAAGAGADTMEMLTTGAHGDHYLVRTAPRRDSIKVRVTTLDAIANEAEWLPTHLKIDVEGFEEEVIMGATELLTTQRPTLFLELHGDILRRLNRVPERPLELLAELGFRHLDLVGRPITASEAASQGVCHLVCTAGDPD